MRLQYLYESGMPLVASTLFQNFNWECAFMTFMCAFLCFSRGSTSALRTVREADFDCTCAHCCGSLVSGTGAHAFSCAFQDLSKSGLLYICSSISTCSSENYTSLKGRVVPHRKTRAKHSARLASSCSQIRLKCQQSCFEHDCS